MDLLVWRNCKKGDGRATSVKQWKHKNNNNNNNNNNNEENTVMVKFELMIPTRLRGIKVS